jgi:hypothetical protein
VLNGQGLNVVGVAGATYVKNYVISTNVHHQYRSQQTITELLDLSKQVHRDFVTLNEPTQ